MQIRSELWKVARVEILRDLWMVMSCNNTNLNGSLYSASSHFSESVFLSMPQVNKKKENVKG